MQPCHSEYSRVPIEVANRLHTEFDHLAPSFLTCLPVYLRNLKMGIGILASTRGSIMRRADPQSGILLYSFARPINVLVEFRVVS